MEERTRGAAFWHGGKRAAKIIGIVMLALLPFGFLEPFLFLVWGSVALVILIGFVGPYLHLTYASETRSFTGVRGECPSCRSTKEPLKPYLSTRFEAEFTVICPACGQTARVRSRA